MKIILKSLITLLLLLLLASNASAQSLTHEAVITKMHGYDGNAVKGVDTTTLHGKVMCGYQGWFTAPNDGSQRGWSHYSKNGKFEPGACSIDLWPDVSELADDEKFATKFQHVDGSPAAVFSSHHPQTVQRHFRWMQEYGIDGAFVQRFPVETFHPANLNHCNTVLNHCRAGANLHGRTYAVMYDLSGLQAGQIEKVIDDWKLLVDRMKITKDEQDLAYLHHNGKPVVTVWGVGFNDNRKYTLSDCEKLIRFLKDDQCYGGCTVMIGVPTYWRTLNRDAMSDAKLHEIMLQADIISPWAVGRYDSPAGAKHYAEQTLKADLEWCRQRKKECLPVVFPGFSWHNMHPEARFNQTPRLRGEFLWTQYVQAKQAGATMIYQAMFDEMDEGTAIFKCTSQPPVGASKFVAEADLPSDHYLWLTGQGGRLLRGEVASPTMPVRK